MRLTEHELTAALTGAAKAVLAAQDKSVRKGRRTIEDAWEELSRYERFVLLDGLGDQLLPVLVGLPDVEVPVGERPSFTKAEIAAVVEERLGADEKGLRRKALITARVALVQLALDSIPPRQDPDAFIVPDHL
ncbi:hypothetical protein E8D34_15870 [Nocardioides sp. GY 10113]|uniref:hypothetical protein n=1 Tax=Nocardioides sp. GY 10113 TaxID=2569761 RepID=UPI0010A7D658|nr:hypothetical protein [Nocardioides sp. GY 10113]TIC83599.1 hypothetical protein E8D34_15870 [Nocardioides sp. GY 10113]